MRVLLPLPVILPLLAAGLSMAVARRRVLQRIISVVTLGATSGVAFAILLRVRADGPAATAIGGWDGPIGIVLVADLLSALLLVVAAPVLLAVLVYAIGQPGTEQQQPGFHPVYLVLAAGVALALLTGDLFNLFVAFEMTLTASYVLLTIGGGREQVRSGMTFVVISLIASMLLITTIGFIYAATGTVNMADLAVKAVGLPSGVRTAFALLLFMVFGIKAAVFPLFFWLPDSYPTAPTSVTAVFAGLSTKVGVYAIIRTETLIIPAADRPGTFLMWIAAATMIVGVLGAIAQSDVKRILSFHIVSQIGYMVMGLALFTVAGIGAAIFYVMNQIVLKSTLLLTGGLVEHAAGSGKLSEIGGLARRFPLLGWLFLVPALSLAGVPPFSGFVAKLAVVQAGVDSSAWAMVAVSLAVSLLTLFSMTKIWGGAFWGDPQLVREPSDPTTARYGATWPMLGATAGLVVVSLVLAVCAGELVDLCQQAAADLLAPHAYIRAVLG